MSTKVNSTSKDQKMAPPHTCHKCRKPIDTGFSVKCLTCKNYYDFDCMGISEKLYRLKDAETKKKIKCKSCVQKTKKGQSTSNSNPNYVTMRKKYSSPKLSSTPNATLQIQTITKAANESQNDEIFSTPAISASTLNTPMQGNSTSLSDYSMTEENLVINIPTNNTFSMLSDDEESDYQLHNTNRTLRRSCPNLHASTSENPEELKHTICKLQTDLASAHSEVELLLSEKFALQKQISAYQAKVKQLTLLCKTSTSPATAGEKQNAGRTKNIPLGKKEEEQNQNHESSFHQLHLNHNYIMLNTNQNEKNPDLKTNELNSNCDENLEILEKATTEDANTAGVKIVPIKTEEKHRVIILADQQGRDVQQTLQELLGTNYNVFCYWKPGASLFDILSTCKSELSNLSYDDYVIIIGFKNDTSIFTIRYILASWISTVQNTNIIVCESPYNSHLNEKKLNHEINFICNQFKNSVFLDMNFARWIPRKKYFTVNLCRNILQEILRLYYNRSYIMYKQRGKIISTNTIATQTEYSTLTNQSTQTEVHNSLHNTSTHSTTSSDDQNNEPNIELFRE